MTMTLKSIAEHIGGRLIGNADTEVSCVCPAESPRQGGLCVVWTQQTMKDLEGSPVSACVTTPGLEIEGVNCILVPDPRAALVELLHLLHPRRKPAAGVEAGAIISPAALVSEGVFIAAGAQVAAGARLAAGVEIHSNVVVGADVTIGEDTVVFANATIYAGTTIGRRVFIHSGAVIGGDGFGYSRDADGRYHKIPQIGIVEIEDDVEIGACATIDRATIGRTVIRRGTKVDNLVQVAHNCDVGEDCVLVAQAGLAGSVTIGDRTQIGGQAGISDHVSVGPDMRVAAQSGVPDDIKGGYWMGSPALPAERTLRAAALTARLPELRDQLRELRARCAALEEEIAALRARTGGAETD